MDTNGNFVITISRELGSGGRTVGRKLAEKLGVRYSDKELIHALMRKFNLTASGIEKLKGEARSVIASYKAGDDFDVFVNRLASIGYALEDALARA